MGDKWKEGVKIIKKWVTSFMDGPQIVVKINLCINYLLKKGLFTNHNIFFYFPVQNRLNCSTALPSMRILILTRLITIFMTMLVYPVFRTMISIMSVGKIPFMTTFMIIQVSEQLHLYQYTYMQSPKKKKCTKCFVLFAYLLSFLFQSYIFVWRTNCSQGSCKNLKRIL